MLQQVRVRGLRELRRELRDAGAEFPKQLRAAHKEIATEVSDAAEAAAPARASGVLKGAGTQRAAVLRIGPGRGDALAVFMGQRRRSGWYAAARYQASPGRQFKPWVGNQWAPGETGGKPYHIGDAINRKVPDVLDRYAEMLDRIAADAFPD